MLTPYVIVPELLLPFEADIRTVSLLASLAILLTLLIVGAEGDAPDPPPPELLGTG